MLECAVVIPLYNGAAWIERTLQSVLRQTRRPAEIIVVDDGSQDDSVQRVRAFSQVRLLSNPCKGGGFARDLGMHHALAPLIVFLDQDDLWHPDHLLHLAQTLEANPQASAVTACSTHFHDEERLLYNMPSAVSVRPLSIWSDFPLVRVDCPSAVLTRRELVERLGGWRCRTKTVADIELWLLLATQGSFLQTDAISVGRRVDQRSYSAQLRGQRLGDYLQAWCTALTAVAATRRESNPEESDFLHRRLDFARTIRDLGSHFMRDDRAAFLQAADEFASMLQHEPERFQWEALDMLFWFLCPPQLSWRKRTLLQDLYCHWHTPRLAGIARSLQWPKMRDWSWASFVLGLVTHPRQPQRWKLLRRSVVEHSGPVRATVQCTGIDGDGWALADSTVRIPLQSPHAAVQLAMQVPPWAAIESQPITIDVLGYEQQQVTLRHGIYALTASAPPGQNDVVIRLRAAEAFALPNEDRRRCFRLLASHFLTAPCAVPALRLVKEAKRAA